MELRSTKRRSVTPFGNKVERFSEDERANHVEKSINRTTTTKKTTIIRSGGEAVTSMEAISTYASKPSRKSNLRSSVYKTSDYSSEEGENEVSSTKSISQNEKNQFIEDARAAANGNGEVSALELYRKSGRYWDIYPKTDWTYSHYSKDRVELAPGVVAMPNMSRKTIHSIHSDSESYTTNYLDKETNTESLHAKRRLFNNNYVKHRQYERISYWRRFKWSVTETFVSIFTFIANVFYYSFEVQRRFFSKLHNFTSRVMLWDTWLLRETRAGSKAAKLAALCLIPMVLLGGWWCVTNIGSMVYHSYFNGSTNEALMGRVEGQVRDEQEKIVEIREVVEKIHLEPPKPEEIAAQLTDSQFEAISGYVKDLVDVKREINTESIVQNIVSSPLFHEALKSYKIESKPSDYEKINDELRAEIENLKTEINNIKIFDERNFLKLKQELVNNHALVLNKLNRCCGRSVINIENSVKNVMTALLNDENFLRNQNGFNEYLQTIFLAKSDLESHLSALTANLSSRYDEVIKDNSEIIMNKLNDRLKNEILNVVNVNNGNGAVKSIGEGEIRRIVKEVLAVYDADKTGLVDYAMETIGGQILTTRCTENYRYGKAVVSILGVPLWYPTNSPRTVITAGTNPGECWAFQNFPGFLVIQLSSVVEIEAFSMEHVSKLLAPNGKIDSAPNEFEVYGLKSENDKDAVLLGTYFYDSNGEPIQYFSVKNEGHVFGIVELRVVSNHGNPNYTCLYRFRVHGRFHSEHYP